MLNQLNSTTKRELDEKYLTSVDLDDIEDDIEQIQGALSDVQGDLETLTNRVNTYLDTEQLVGHFGDDDLYQITVDIGALPNNTTKYVSTDIDASQIIKIEGIATAPQSGGTDKAITIPIPFTGSGGTYVGLYAHILSTDKISIRISTDADRSAYSGFVTIQYTKPTPTQTETETETEAQL